MKVFSGIAVANNMSKTVTVEVERFLSHPVYKKRFKRSRKYQVHTETDIKVGDKVRFVATKPYSRTKKWKVILGKSVAKKEVEVSEAKGIEKKTVKTAKVSKKGK